MKRAVALGCAGALLVSGCAFGGHGDDLAEGSACATGASKEAIPKYNYSLDDHVSAQHTVDFRTATAPFLGAPYDERLYQFVSR